MEESESIDDPAEDTLVDTFTILPEKLADSEHLGDCRIISSEGGVTSILATLPLINPSKVPSLDTLLPGDNLQIVHDDKNVLGHFLLDAETFVTEQTDSIPIPKFKVTTAKAATKKEEPLKKRPKAYQCPECEKSYTSLHHLKVHRRNHTGTRPYSCTIEGCEKSFSTLYSRKAHVRTHTGERPYKCRVCCKGFKTSGDLQKHTRTHTGERPFKCPVEGCTKAFTTSTIRTVHIRSHTGERPFLCDIAGCGRKFASSSNYKNHMRIHTGEKPYVCPLSECMKRFTEYSSLYKHMTVHAQSKNHSCLLCPKTYKQLSSLTTHQKVAHSGATSVKNVSGTLIAIDEEELNGPIFFIPDGIKLEETEAESYEINEVVNQAGWPVECCLDFIVGGAR